MNKVERINQILRHAKQLRNEQEAIQAELRQLASEMATLHGVDLRSSDATDLNRVVRFGDNYENTMRSIMDRKK